MAPAVLSKSFISRAPVPAIVEALLMRGLNCDGSGMVLRGRLSAWNEAATEAAKVAAPASANAQDAADPTRPGQGAAASSEAPAPASANAQGAADPARPGQGAAASSEAPVAPMSPVVSPRQLSLASPTRSQQGGGVLAPCVASHGGASPCVADAIAGAGA